MAIVQSIDRDLQRRLDDIRAQHGDSVRIDQVAEVVRSMLDTLTGDVTAADLRLYRELEGLAEYIHAAKAEIASLRPKEIQDKYIASATDELDAIVDATEVATNQILDNVEAIENLANDMPPEIAAKVADHTTLLYEACNFQDITGQRITKVVRALKHIEEKIEGLVAAFGPGLEEDEEKAPALAAPAEITDESLLNGPALPSAAANQADIDRLFSSFD